MRRVRARKWSHRPLITITAATHIVTGPSSAALSLAGATVALSSTARDAGGATTSDQVFYVCRDTRLGIAHKTSGIFTAATPKVPGTARVHTQLTDPDALPVPDSYIWTLQFSENFSSFADLAAFDDISRGVNGTAVPSPGEVLYGQPAPTALMSIVPSDTGPEKWFRQLKPGPPTGGGVNNCNLRYNIIQRVASVPNTHSSFISADFRMLFRDSDGSLLHDRGDGPGLRLKFFESGLRPNSGRYQFGAALDYGSQPGKFTSWQVRHTMFTNPENNAFGKCGITPAECFADKARHHFDTWHAGSTLNGGAVDILMYEFDASFTAAQSFTTGDRIRLLRQADPPNGHPTDYYISAAEFIVLYNISGNTWRVQRAPNISGSTATVNGYVYNFNHETHSLRFSTSQANVVFPGSMIAITNFGGFTISNSDYDGALFDLKPTRHPTDAYMTVGQDLFGYPFSSHLDGFSRLWMDGELIHEFSLEKVGILSPDGVTPWCVKADLATVTPGAVVEEQILGDNTTWNTDPYYVDFTNITHYTTPLRRSR